MTTEIYWCLPAFLPVCPVIHMAAKHVWCIKPNSPFQAGEGWWQLCFATSSPQSRDKLARFSPWDAPRVHLNYGDCWPFLMVCGSLRYRVDIFLYRNKQ